MSSDSSPPPSEARDIVVDMAPGDQNMESDRIVVQASPRESFHRPSINALFRSAAQAYGRRLSHGDSEGWGRRCVEDLASRRCRHCSRPNRGPLCRLAKARYRYRPRGLLRAIFQIADLIQNFAMRPRRAPRDSKARVLIVEDERIVFEFPFPQGVPKEIRIANVRRREAVTLEYCWKKIARRPRGGTTPRRCRD